MKNYLIVLSLIISAPKLAAEQPLSVLSDPKAKYFVIEKEGSRAERTIVTKRVGPSGTSYAKRLYNCDYDTVKYLGTGDSLSKMAESKRSSNMILIMPGSIAYYLRIEACR